MNPEPRVPGLLGDLEPFLLPEPFVFTTVDSFPANVTPFATVVEDEGTTLILEQGEADRLGLLYSFVAAKITLRVTSSLDAVGLTAAVSACLADAGISCNIVAGSFHDHVFVPIGRGKDAEAALKGLAGV